MATTEAADSLRTTARSSARNTPTNRVAAVCAFAGALGLVLLYALRGSGSYDLVAFEENGLIIWFLVALGVALGLLPRRRPSRGMLVLLASLAGYAVWTALSLIWTSSSELTFAEVARVLDYLGVVTLIAFALDRTTWRPAAAGLGFGAFVVCLVAVGSRLAPSVFGTDSVDASLHIDRLALPFGYWNAVAAWGAMATALGLAWSSHDSSRVRRAVALGFVPVATATTYLTYSRAGVGGTVFGVVVVWALSRNRLTVVVHAAIAAIGTGAVILVIRGAPEIAHATGTSGAAGVFLVLLVAPGVCAGTALLTSIRGVDRWRVPRRAARALAATAGVVVLVAAVVAGPTEGRKAWHSFTKIPIPNSSVNPTARLSTLSGTRYPLWKATLKAFDAHPLDGIGAGTTEFWWNQHATDDEFIRDAHSIWIQNLEELGLPGLLLIVAVAASALGLGITARRRVKRATNAGVATAGLAVFIVYLLHASVDWMWESTAVTVLALASIAVLGGRLADHRPRLWLAGRVAIVLVAFGAAILQLPGILSTTEIQRSQAAEQAGQGALALGWAQDAINAEPWSASAYQQRGLVLESAGQFGPAAADLERAISREPQNYVHWLILSRIETERGKLGVAVRDYLRARQLAPRAQVFQPALVPARP
jgi:hypothetical protein